ncbi:cob(I)yrinic acid a,c-diamide adenosyltransferase [Anaeromyxobacter sp. PSR-1]|uniref:cob(I)yrinic acid a,c-diamide adenosyltransferase n=1 Tax=Anaeromyxobacter sp. PSR-1 TaxID=1300915 RepID=UPI0005E94BEC|nr:cob(I)yrinic acid a,c-diamide adenosyltransferase [Anaeromyxobacter sp. PSR-1]GAO03302.1 cob(I)yrinic acid a,c-diamide adenosyltransferase [Anaeromyxobacter sp. PSR-1]
MKIYTKTGDAGETGLFGGPRVRKSDARVEAYGEVDELNACLGTVRAQVEDPEIDAQLARIQDELFCVGAELATPHGEKARSAIPAVEQRWAERLEGAIDAWEAELPPLRQFVLPGGTRTAAQLHLARCVCRRAERRVVALAAEAEVSPVALAYLNRLSDFLFVAARVANHRARKPETAWDPRRER